MKNQLTNYLELTNIDVGPMIGGRAHCLGDKDYQEKFNIDDTNFSKDRIDILDFVKENTEISKQEKLQKEIDAIDPKALEN